MIGAAIQRRAGYGEEETVGIDESGLTKVQVRKLNALRKSVGDALGEEALRKWLKQNRHGVGAAEAGPGRAEDR